MASEAQFVNYAVYTSIQHLLRVPSTNQQVNWKYIDNINIKTNVNHPFLLLMAKNMTTVNTDCLQCFDTVGLAAGRAFGLSRTEWWAAGMVICLEHGADLHKAQLMPLPLTVSCFSKIQIGFTFLVPAHLGSPGKRAIKQVCVCVNTDRVNGF